MAQSVKHPTSAQVMISHSVSLSPASGSVLITQSLEPASNSVSPFLSAPLPTPTHALSLSVSKIIKTCKKIKKKEALPAFRNNWVTDRPCPMGAILPSMGKNWYLGAKNSSIFMYESLTYICHEKRQTAYLCCYSFGGSY